MSSSAVRLAIFDFDGTLADSFPWFTSVLNDVARRHGFREADWSEAEMLRSLNTRELLREMRVPLWKIPAIARDLRARKLAASDTIAMFPGAHEALVALQSRGVMLAMVSSDGEESVRRTLPAETAALFSHSRFGASLFGKAGKLRDVVRASGIPPQDAIYVGDETRDGQAARKAGLRFGAATYGYSNHIALMKLDPDVVLGCVADVALISAASAPAA
jgi:phosphoglycolate phosphatase